MTRQEYLQGQRDITKTTVRAETEGARAIRKATREAMADLIKAISGGHIPGPGEPVFDKQALAARFLEIIQEYAEKPVKATRELQDRFERELGERLGIEIPARKSTVKNEKKPNAADKITKILGRALGVGVGISTTSISAYHRDPETGKIVWDDTPLEYIFRERYDLSTRVWKSVDDMEASVMSLLQGCIAMGESKAGTIKDLETYINYANGGERVAGRWGKMFSNTPEGRREAWKRQYLAEHGGLQYGTDAAKELLRQPDAKTWLKSRMGEKTKRGTPRLPDAVVQYSRRLGKTGLDYRVIRIERTEIAAMLSDEKKETARNSFISSGKMEWVLERGRDHWSCRCEELAAGGPYDAEDPRDSSGNPVDIPLHPNCSCMWRPILLSDDEVMKRYKEAIRSEQPEKKD